MNFILVLGREVPVYLVVEWQTKRKKDYEEKVGLRRREGIRPKEIREGVKVEEKNQEKGDEKGEKKEQDVGGGGGGGGQEGGEGG